MTEQHTIVNKLIWRDEYLRLICAFANAQGGKICISISKGKPTGFLECPD